MTKTVPCPCGKPTGVLSRRSGTELLHQVICSDASCPIIDVYNSAEEAAKVWNDLMTAYVVTGLDNLVNRG